MLTDQTETQSFFRKVYLWMSAGLAVSGITAYTVSANSFLSQTILNNNLVFISLLIFELVLVISLSVLIKKIPAKLAAFLFLLYSFTTGLTLSVIFLVYEMQSIGTVFLITAGMFVAMSIYGYFTKKDLTQIGQVLIMGLFGIIIASFVNLFLNNSLADFIVSLVGVVIFTGLTAYDTQKIKQKNILGNEGTEEDIKESIIGALDLYLDFVNLFLKLLRLLGKKKK
jgi:FtsH-binding integral membrane protein